MGRPSNWLYIWVFGVALGTAFLLTPLTRRFAHRLGIDDRTGTQAAHVEPIALLGGLAIYGGAFAAAWTLVSGARAELKGFFLAGLVMAVFGLQDDVSPMDPWLKIVAQVASALVLVGFGVQVHLTSVEVVNVVLTVVWVVTVVNAVNYQDNMDGLAAGLTVMSALGLFALAVTTGQYLVAVLSIALAGGALGFLPSNYPQARSFMGDSGSMFLGFVLAFLGIRIRFLDKPLSSTFLLPVLLLAVPLFDAALVTLSRLRRGVSPLTGGVDHTSHRLVRLGLPPWAGVAVLWAAQGVCSLGALAASRHGRTIGVGIVAVTGFSAVVAALLLERSGLAPEAGA